MKSEWSLMGTRKLSNLPGLLALAFSAVTWQQAADAMDSAEAIAFFESKIRPVLVRHCYECHSADAATTGELGGGLQLDTREGIRRGGASGAAVVPEQPGPSLLLAALRHEQGLKMPPDDDPLPAAVVADFEKWIASGAADPRDGKPVAVGVDFAQARQFWSLQPVTSPELPAVDDVTWPRRDLDCFVLARLASEALQPVNNASRPVLLRRLFFDLIGLPPTLDDVQRLGVAPIENVVDELLASPHFGERWGRHWLDIARFAESNGRARNMAWHHAWRYRDWVIDALNFDLPYDEFLTQQIAGDLLPFNDREQHDRQVVATGFLALGPKSLEETKRELFRMDVIDEQIDVICRGILGISASCARCHDHKFDPVPTSDYYALAGILRSTDTLYGIGPMGIKGVNDAPLAVMGPDAEQLAGPAAEHLAAVQNKTQERNTARSDRYRVVRNVADRKRQLDKPGIDKPALEAEIAKMEAEIADWDDRIKTLDVELAELVDNPPPQPLFAMGARDARQPEDCRIRIRGEPENYGDAVPRGVLRMIAISNLPGISTGESGRLQLAQWLSSPGNPLTARVFVNRVWLHLFGRGLVATPDDFGVTGAKPSHPQLLDHLASRFMQSDWSIKQLIRDIVLSRTYQLASTPSPDGLKRDPDNVLLWRMPVRQIEVEPFRDALLAVSGLLDRQRPEGSVIQQIGVFSDYEFNFRIKLTPEMVRSKHRSIYLPIVRGSLPEMLQLFDFADPNALIGQRDQATVPSQALFLLNSPTMIEFATVTANRLLAEEQLDDAGRLDLLYQLALARKPTDDERASVLSFLKSTDSSRDQVLDAAATAESANSDSEALGHSHREAWVSVCQAVVASSEFRNLK
ncbi:DUF1553 domain-containing protein [bacterium]|nr:DUF1553 domain-containing protein [bacterium]